MQNEITPECIGSQTVGPYYAIGLAHLVTEMLAGASVPGEHITLTGTIVDGNGDPIPDAILEFWQASPDGNYKRDESFVAEPSSSEFAGFARLSSHDGGRFRLNTVKPGPVLHPDGGLQAPHLVVLIFMRGLLKHLMTRVYFHGDARNASDRTLALVPEHRQATLIATSVLGDPSFVEWNIRMQGENETVFFNC